MCPPPFPPSPSFVHPTVHFTFVLNAVGETVTYIHVAAYKGKFAQTLISSKSITILHIYALPWMYNIRISR